MWAQMSDVYLQCLILFVMNQLLIVGVWSCCQKGMVFGFIADWVWERIDHWYCKPLFQCISCMSSIYGSLFFYFSPLSSLLPWWCWPLHCLCLCGLGTVIQAFLNEPE